MNMIKRNMQTLSISVNGKFVVYGGNQIIHCMFCNDFSKRETLFKKKKVFNLKGIYLGKIYL